MDLTEAVTGVGASGRGMTKGSPRDPEAAWIKAKAEAASRDNRMTPEKEVSTMRGTESESRDLETAICAGTRKRSREALRGGDRPRATSRKTTDPEMTPEEPMIHASQEAT
jgi:hypothetical protein